MKLTVQNAEIKTATVEVKTLTISGKQVTLAVFRQLLRGPLVADGGTYNGIPWGTVNYHQRDCPRAGHLHVVWQQGAELRHAIEEPRIFDKDVWPKSANMWLDVALLLGWRSHLADSRPEIFVDFAAGRAGIDVDSIQRQVLWPGSIWRDPAKTAAYQEEKRSEALAEIRERVTKWCTPTEEKRQELLAAVGREITSLIEIRERHGSAWAELRQLPQLFIAV